MKLKRNCVSMVDSIKKLLDRIMLKRRKSILVSVLLFAIAISIFIGHLAPSSRTAESFDAARYGRLESDMWRAYYERNTITLYFLSATFLREFFQLGYVSSMKNAWRATWAAYHFSKSTQHQQYEELIPGLEKYYSDICESIKRKCDAGKLASLEINWWVIHRELSHHGPGELSEALAKTAAELYGIPKEKLLNFGQMKTEAMVLRKKAFYERTITSLDWDEIARLLEKAANELQLAIKTHR